MTGDTITVVWAEEHFNVGQYSGFRVGPFSITTIVQPNETDKEAWDRCWVIMEAQAFSMFRAKRDGFHVRFLNRG